MLQKRSTGDRQGKGGYAYEAYLFGSSNASAINALGYARNGAKLGEQQLVG